MAAGFPLRDMNLLACLSGESTVWARKTGWSHYNLGSCRLQYFRAGSSWEPKTLSRGDDSAFRDEGTSSTRESGLASPA